MKRSAQGRAQLANPEMSKLRAWVGRWMSRIELKPGPLGPGGRISHEYTGQMILGGFVYLGYWQEKGVRGQSRGLQIDRYDPLNKNIASSWYLEDGSTFAGVLTISGDTYTWEGRFAVAGTSFLFRDIFVLAPDRKSALVKAESSTDGETWTPLSEGKYTKVRPRPRR